MRYILVMSLALVAAIPAATTSQTQGSEIWITVQTSDVAGASADVPARHSEIYVGPPFAFIGVPGQETTGGVMFGIRAWKEAPKARVVVYAVLEDKRAPGGKTETPIATFAISPGDSILVPQPENWGGKRLTVRAALR